MNQEDRVKSILKILLPSVLCNLLMKVQEIVNLIFVGHSNNSQMIAAVGLGNALLDIMGLSIIIGMNGALNTLSSQSAGAQRIDMCQTYLKRGKVVLTMCFVPIAILLTQSERILLMAGQDKAVARYAAQYIMAYLPGLYLMGMIDIQRRFLNTLKEYTNVMIIQVTAVFFHIASSWLFVDHLQYGIVGTGLAAVSTNAFVYFVLCYYTSQLEDVKKTEMISE